MSKTVFHKAYSLMLIIALAFGQVGAGFFHNKHDAHETVVDLNDTVLVPHGEHCKICSVDWVHQFVCGDFDFEFLEEQKVSFLVFDIIESPDLIITYSNGRAPPIVA
jgi:hypothetical protein